MSCVLCGAACHDLPLNHHQREARQAVRLAECTPSRWESRCRANKTTRGASKFALVASVTKKVCCREQSSSTPVLTKRHLDRGFSDLVRDTGWMGKQLLTHWNVVRAPASASSFCRGSHHIPMRVLQLAPDPQFSARSSFTHCAQGLSIQPRSVFRSSFLASFMKCCCVVRFTLRSPVDRGQGQPAHLFALSLARWTYGRPVFCGCCRPFGILFLCKPPFWLSLVGTWRQMKHNRGTDVQW